MNQLPLTIQGVSRDGNNERCLIVSFNRAPTDAEMQAFHEVLLGPPADSDAMRALREGFVKLA